MKKKRAMTRSRLNNSDVLHNLPRAIWAWGTPPSDEFAHCVRVYWHNDSNEQELWNLRCARIVEIFGLPGDRFCTNISTDWMEFWFRTPEDATLCRLAI